MLICARPPAGAVSAEIRRAAGAVAQTAWPRNPVPNKTGRNQQFILLVTPLFSPIFEEATPARTKWYLLFARLALQKRGGILTSRLRFQLLPHPTQSSRFPWGD